MITHVVLMKLHDPADAVEAKRRIEPLATSVEQVRSLTVEVDVGRGEASYDLVLITTHDDFAGLDGYQQHPAHVEVLDWLRDRRAARAVVDYET